MQLLQNLGREALPVWSQDGEAIGYRVQDDYLSRFYAIDLKMGKCVWCICFPVRYFFLPGDREMGL